MRGADEAHVAAQQPSVPPRDGRDRYFCKKKKKTRQGCHFLLIELQTVLFPQNFLAVVDFGFEGELLRNEMAAR